MEFYLIEDRVEVDRNTLSVTLTLDQDAPTELHFSNGERSITEVIGPIADKEELKETRKRFREDEYALLKNLVGGRKCRKQATRLIHTITVI